MPEEICWGGKLSEGDKASNKRRSVKLNHELSRWDKVTNVTEEKSRTVKLNKGDEVAKEVQRK